MVQIDVSQAMNLFPSAKCSFPLVQEHQPSSELLRDGARSLVSLLVGVLPLPVGLAYQEPLVIRQSYLQPDGAVLVTHEIWSQLGYNILMSVNNNSTCSERRIVDCGANMKIIVLNCSQTSIMNIQQIGSTYPKNLWMMLSNNILDFWHFIY